VDYGGITVDAAVTALAPDYVVVATETADHGRVVDRLAALDFRGRVLVAAFARCPAASIQVNYLDRRTRREVVINTADHTFSADLIAGTLARDHAPPETFPQERDDMYRALHRAVLADHPGPCDAAEAAQVMTMIAAAETAARTGA
jgi:predicted dehydrogenase